MSKSAQYDTRDPRFVGAPKRYDAQATPEEAMGMRGANPFTPSDCPKPRTIDSEISELSELLCATEKYLEDLAVKLSPVVIEAEQPNEKVAFGPDVSRQSSSLSLRLGQLQLRVRQLNQGIRILTEKVDL